MIIQNKHSAYNISIKNITEQLNKLPCPIMMQVIFNSDNYGFSAYFFFNQKIYISISHVRIYEIPESANHYLMQYNIKESEIYTLLAKIQEELINLRDEEQRRFLDRYFLAKDCNNQYYKFRWTDTLEDETQMNLDLFFNKVNHDLIRYEDIKL